VALVTATAPDHGRDTIDELAARVQRWIALDELLFETLGQWVRTVPEPITKRVFATWCNRLAGHAELWRGRLPTYQGRVGADELAARRVAETAAWIEPVRRALAGAGAGDTASKVAALRDATLPSLAAAVDEHRAAIDAPLDGPTARILDLIAADLAAFRAEL
jgi:hypothetical protein